MRNSGFYFLLFFCFSLHAGSLHYLHTLTSGVLKNKNVLSYVMKTAIVTNENVAQHRELLLRSYAHFIDTPGYSDTLCKILFAKSKETVKGHAYELEAALFLKLHLGKQIKAFNQVMTYGPYTCEMDLLTADEMLSLKKIKWKVYKKKQLGKQFKRQAALAALRKQAGEVPYNYGLISGTDISFGWQKWLTEEGIPFQELPSTS